MLAKVFSAAIVGLDARIIEVEVDTSFGLPHFSIVGLPDKTVEESKERMAAAIKSTQFEHPYKRSRRILVNLAPADLKKQGSLYDLPIALGFLCASDQIKFDYKNKIFIGELALDGTLRPVKGALSFALEAREQGFSEIILPKANAPEASLVSIFSEKSDGNKLKVIGVDSLKETIDYLANRKQIPGFEVNINDYFEKTENSVNLAFIKGQNNAKRVMEIAAAGNHNVLMTGPPGTGKTLLAKAISGILPRLNPEEILEVTKIYSVNGLLSEKKPLIYERPFRSPHHTASEAALIGGGNPPRAGEITLAHRGILFLDEFPEFHRDVLESLRQPLEDGVINVLRAKHRLTLPARIMLIAATNPCPCGYRNDPDRECTCSPSQISKYTRKLSGPLMDRIDLFINVPRIKYEELIARDGKDTNSEIKTNIEKARQIQKQRFTNSSTFTNSEISLPEIKQFCEIETQSQSILKNFVDTGKLSMRGYHKILKISRTIADLENSENILHKHIAEALSYRQKEEV